MITAKEAKENRAMCLTEKYSYIFDLIEHASKNGRSSIFICKNRIEPLDIQNFDDLRYSVIDRGVNNNLMISW